MSIMFDHTDISESLSMPIIISPPSGRKEYSPSLLLEHAELKPLLLCNELFYEWCGYGFHSCFDCMYEPDASRKSFVFRLQTFSLTDVTDEIFRDFCARLIQKKTLSWLTSSTGFYVGWLSALALSQQDLASTGMTILISLVRQVLKGESVIVG